MNFKPFVYLIVGAVIGWFGYQFWQQITTDAEVPESDEKCSCGFNRITRQATLHCGCTVPMDEVGKVTGQHLYHGDHPLTPVDLEPYMN